MLFLLNGAGHADHTNHEDDADAGVGSGGNLLPGHDVRAVDGVHCSVLL